MNFKIIDFTASSTAPDSALIGKSGVFHTALLDYLFPDGYAVGKTKNLQSGKGLVYQLSPSATGVITNGSDGQILTYSNGVTWKAQNVVFDSLDSFDSRVTTLESKDIYQDTVCPTVTIREGGEGYYSEGLYRYYGTIGADGTFTPDSTRPYNVMEKDYTNFSWYTKTSWTSTKKIFYISTSMVSLDLGTTWKKNTELTSTTLTKTSGETVWITTIPYTDSRVGFAQIYKGEA